MNKRALSISAAALFATGCAVTPQYAVRPLPVPDESRQALGIEQSISRVQAQELEKQGVRPIQPGERLWGFDVNATLQRLARVTERPGLPYRAYLLTDDDPNAAALADGRTYVTTGLLQWLSQRPNGENELAFVLSHELAHTTAQHLVDRYYTLQRRQLLMTAVSLGAQQVAGAGGESLARAAGIAQNVASIVNEVSLNGYSQGQELESDQLGLRYLQRAGYDTSGALSLLQGFQQFDQGAPFLRTHPYASERYQQLSQYLRETAAQPAGAAPVSLEAPVPAANFVPRAAGERRLGESREDRIRFLRSVQKTYPPDSVSWRNLEKQIQALAPEQ